MYKLEKRGQVTRYYNAEKMDLINKNHGNEWNKYRELWEQDSSQKWHGKLLEVLFELTSWCNYTCKMCFRNYYKQPLRESMSIESVKKVANEIGEMGVCSIWIGANSECLLHPRIGEALEVLLSVKTLDSTLITNGSLLNDHIMKLLIDNEAKQLSISLDAVTQNTYRKIRGGNLAIVEKNINRFLDMRGDAIFPILRVSMVEIEDNIGEREEFLKKWEGLADIIDYQAVVDFSNMDDFNGIKRWRTDCRDPFRRLLIDYKGDIFPCCTEYGKYYPLGNILEKTLQEVWNDEKITNLRSCFQKGEIPLPCRKCTAF